MRFFWNYIFPVLFGLIIYASIRLVNDSLTGEQFWERSLRQNTIEICFSIALAFVSDRLLRRAINGFNKRSRELCIQNVLREFGTVCLVCLVIFNPILYLIHYLINDPVDWADIIIGNLLIVLYVLLYYAIARGNKLLSSYVEQRTQIEKIRNEQLQTELKFLKAQYHPHFLFNALNTIYFQMDENVAEAKETVEKFSELLRYQLYDQQQKVPVQQELDYLQNFIHIQKARASEKLQLSMDIDNSIIHEKVYPLLFLPLVENAFKYVGGAYRLHIAARKENAHICLEVENSLPAIAQKDGGGIGLENLQRRLELLYPGAHRLITKRTDDTFSATLKIPLHEN